jgi:hypothetical protein
MLLHILSYSFCTESHISPKAVANKSFKHYVRKGCSDLVPTLLAKLATGGSMGLRYILQLLFGEKLPNLH